MFKFIEPCTGEPIRCDHCLRKSGLFTVEKDSVANIVCEVETRCQHCGNGVAYWAYGSWEPRDEPRITWQGIKTFIKTMRRNK